MKQIYISNIDVDLLYKQRNTLLAIQDLDMQGQDVITDNMFNDIQGLVNLLDHMLDTAEGYY